jgi:hypothetical protein
VPNTDFNYYLVGFDENGKERAQSDGSFLSRAVLKEVAEQPVTDVFVMSHGWRGDGPAAVGQYDAWMGNLMASKPDIEAMKRLRPNFRLVLVGWHWPSEPFGEEGAGSFAPDPSDPVAALVDDYAQRIGDEPDIRDELRTIIRAHMTIDDPQNVPPEVAAAYQRLEQNMGLGQQGETGAPGTDRPPFDPDDVFQAARQADAESEGDIGSFGGFRFGNLLAPLRVLSFYKMKDRARKFGEAGAHAMLKEIRQQAAQKDVQIHLMGHSFGCIVVSAAAAGPADTTNDGKVASIVLVQGALSLWSYCPDLPSAKGTPGYFNRILKQQNVDGPIVTTQSEFDSAVGTFYPIAAGLKNQVAFAESLPRFGAVGSFGIQGLDATGRLMGNVGEDYRFERGKIYNLDSSKIIKSGGPPSGAHSDIVHPEVAHVIWAGAVAASSGKAAGSPQV